MNSKSLPKIKDILSQSNFKIKKSFGQNFLFDLNLTNKIVKKSIPFAKTVIEIGPGPGALTRSILDNGMKNLYVIEKDIKSIQLLDTLQKLYSNELNIIQADALKFPFWNLGTYPRQIIANLPYNISTKFLIILLKNIKHFNKLTLMFQKEVAKRLTAKPNSKYYGRLSILMSLLTESKILFDIPNTAFIPKPKVLSSVIEIIPLTRPKYKFKFENIEKITQLTFSKRRKMLRTIFKNYGGDLMLNNLGISSNKRPEDLTDIEFCKLSEKVYKS